MNNELIAALILRAILIGLITGAVSGYKKRDQRILTVNQIKAQIRKATAHIEPAERIEVLKRDIEYWGERLEIQHRLAVGSNFPDTRLTWVRLEQETKNTIIACRELITELTTKGSKK